MKSALGWYYNAVNDIVIARINNKIDDELLIQNLLNAYLQAKEMEKQQIILAYINGQSEVDAYSYYEKTFKSE